MDIKDLVSVGAQFGHLRARFNSRMQEYVWGVKNDVMLIDVSKTVVLAKRAAKFLEEIAAEGKPVMFIGTKKSAKDTITSIAQSLDMPYVSHRWIGGTLSNNLQVKKSVTKLLHLEDVLTKTEKYPLYTKKEINVFGKIVERLKKNVGGIRNLKWPIGAIVIVDVVKEFSALKEAACMGIPVVAIVDTNGDPSLVDYVIPANDDSARSVKLILDYLSEAVAEGKKKALEGKKLDKPVMDKGPKVKEVVQQEEVVEAIPASASFVGDDE